MAQITIVRSTESRRLSSCPLEELARIYVASAGKLNTHYTYALQTGYSSSFLITWESTKSRNHTRRWTTTKTEMFKRFATTFHATLIGSIEEIAVRGRCRDRMERQAEFFEFILGSFLILKLIFGCYKNNPFVDKCVESMFFFITRLK